MKYATTFKKLFVEESDEDIDGQIYYKTVINEDLDPIYPNINVYSGKWKLINTCANEKYIFWTWELKQIKSENETDF